MAASGMAAILGYLYVGFTSSSDPHACKASILPTKLSPRPRFHFSSNAFCDRSQASQCDLQNERAASYTFSFSFQHFSVPG